MILTILISIVSVLIILFIWKEMLNDLNRRIHINKNIINKSYDEVWNWFADINKYPEMYPNWIDEVEVIEEDYFVIWDQHGKEYEAQMITDKECGVVDLYMQGEVSRTRLISLNEYETLMLHIGEREDFSLPAWLYLKRTIKSDFNNAKWLIENS